MGVPSSGAGGYRHDTSGESFRKHEEIGRAMIPKIYQVEVKLCVVRMAFPPSGGWRVTLDVDPMECGRGGCHPAGKSERALAALEALRLLGATIEEHDIYGRVDIVADHPDHGRRLIEVEGDSSRQPEQAMYSALGQVLLRWNGWNEQLRYGLAVPDARPSRRQVAKLPLAVRRALGIELYLARCESIVILGVDEAVPA